MQYSDNVLMYDSNGITIIGLGAVGNTIAEACLQKSIPVNSLVTSNKRKAHYFQKRGIPVFNRVDELFINPDSLIFITVPDDSIEDIASEIAKNVKSNILSENVIVAHCSGALTSDVLNPLELKGAATVAFHPLQTFSLSTGVDRFHDIFVSLEGDETAVKCLKKLVTILGADPLVLSKDQKKALHIAAVFASNYLVGLLHAAEKVASNAGIDDPITKLKPLVEQTMLNIFSSGPGHALSGPVKRGDLVTVRNHLNFLQAQPNQKEFYLSGGSYLMSMLEQMEGEESLKSEPMKKMFQHEQGKEE